MITFPARRALPVALAGVLLVTALLGGATAHPKDERIGALAGQPRLRAVTASALLASGEPGDELAHSGVVPTGTFARATAQAALLGEQTARSSPALATAAWTLNGPTNVGGRVLDVVVDPLHADTMYVATASGGVWRSSDAGARFSSVWPDALTQSVGALAITPTGVLYAGTGEAGPGGGSITYGGTGVYRSADGGRHWTVIGLAGSERIGRIVVDPHDERILWVAANGPLYSAAGERGLYRSGDAGKTWLRMLAGSTPTTGAVDVALDPGRPDVVYATMWDRIRYPDKRVYTGVGSGAFKSVDAGRSWARIGGSTLMANPELGRLGIALSPSHPSRVYLLASTEAGLTAGMYRSDDAGATFTPGVDLPLITGGFVYAWWFGRVYVDPANPDHVFATGVNMSESKNGGVSFASSPGLHSDQHAMAWDPRARGRVYVGNDGGVYRSADNGTSFTHGVYMPWNQPFSIDISQQDPRRIVVGLQDNGGNRNYRKGSPPAADGYHDITGGDGTEMRIDPRDDNVVYGCSQYGACAVSADGGETTNDFSDLVVGARKAWRTPIEFDPAVGHAVYTASEIVSRSLDDGKTWRPISPDLTGGPGRETNPLFRNYGCVTTLAVAGDEQGTIYAGTDDGRVQVTHDGGVNWRRSTGLPSDWVTKVANDPRGRGQVAYATFSGFRSDKRRASVFRTADGGLTWSDISGNLPQAPVNDVLVLGRDLVVATDVGVFLTRDVAVGQGRQWLRVGAGLPNAPIQNLRWHAASRTLFAADFGRGAFQVRLPH